MKTTEEMIRQNLRIVTILTVAIWVEVALIVFAGIYAVITK